MSDIINEYYRYGTKNEDGTVTWGDWQNTGGNYMPISGGTFTGGYFGTTVEVDGVEVDISKGSVFEINLTESVALSFTGVPANAAACFSVIVNVADTASSGVDITWPDSVEWPGGSIPTIDNDSTNVFTFLSGDGGNKWFGSVVSALDSAKANAYKDVGTVDLNDYSTAYYRIYVNADSENLPVDTEMFLVDVDFDSEMTVVRQTATGAASGIMYIRNGVLSYDGDGNNDYSVEWGEWVELGAGTIDVATDEDVDEKLKDIFGEPSSGGGGGSGGIEVASDEDVEKGLQDIFDINLDE